MIWSTAIIEFIKENNIPVGFFTQTPYWKLNEDIKKSFLEFKYTDEEIENLNLIKNDIFKLLPFINTVKIRDYQEDLLSKVFNERFNLIVNSRQCGISTVHAITILHYILTNTDKNVVIVSDKSDSSIELISKIKKLYFSLPFYMKPGVETWNQSSIKFDNGVTLRRCTQVSPILIGFNIDYLLIQEAAHIVNFENIYRSIFPSISALKNSKIVISSTPNGINSFYNLYNATTLKNTAFNLTKVYWYQVEGRDEKWKQEAILNIGSLEAFDQEYNLKFHGEYVKNDNEILTKIDNILLDLKNEISIKSVKQLNKLVKELKKIAKD